MTVRRPGQLGGQRGPLSDEDVRLWELMKQRLEPLRNAKRRVGNGDPAAQMPVLANAASGLATAPEKAGKLAKPMARPRRTEPVQPPAVAPIARKTSFVPAVSPSSTPIEKRKSRQLAKGQRPIEAVLDLHGMRQREAHASLRRFIATSHASGCKFVKVITGKGARLSSDDARDRPFDAPGSGDHGEGERGVLKRLVPEWLREPGIGALVVGFSSAGRGHGGAGALYVELRRQERMRPKT
jgi:DNA-nicking Smr family endonuclease